MGSESSRQGWGLVRGSEEVDVSEEAAVTRRQRSARWETRRHDARDSPLAILDSTQNDGVPKRVQLAPSSVHDVAEVFINLLGRQSWVCVGSRLGSLLGTESGEDVRAVGIGS